MCLETGSLYIGFLVSYFAVFDKTGNINMVMATTQDLIGDLGTGGKGIPTYEELIHRELSDTISYPDLSDELCICRSRFSNAVITDVHNFPQEELCYAFILALLAVWISRSCRLSTSSL